MVKKLTGLLMIKNIDMFPPTDSSKNAVDMFPRTDCSKDIRSVLSSQDESRGISENSTWGIRRRFEQGQYKISTKRFIGYENDEDGKLIINKEQAKIVVRIYEEFLTGKTVDHIARILKAEKIKSWDGKYNWQPKTLDSMLRNEKYKGDTILQKSYTTDFLTKKRVMNDGTVQMYHIEEDHEAIIDAEMWEAVQLEIKRRAQYCMKHQNNAYSQKSEVNPFYGKIICGTCGHSYSRVKYKDRKGNIIVKWRCGSSNMVGGKKVCSNRYVREETLMKLFLLGWNEIVEYQEDYQKKWNANLKSDDVLLRYKTNLLMKRVLEGMKEEFDPELMMMVMDYITVFEDGRLQIKFYDGTEFEVATE